MDQESVEYDVTKCVICGEKQPSVGNMMDHLLGEHIALEAINYKSHHLKCPGCDFTIDIHRPSAILRSRRDFINHFAGRIGAGVTTPPLTFQEIFDHLFYGTHANLLGVKP